MESPITIQNKKTVVEFKKRIIIVSLVYYKYGVLAITRPKMFLSPTRCLGTRTFGYLIAARSIKDNARDAVKCQFTPVQITVPWGKIEGARI